MYIVQVCGCDFDVEIDAKRVQTVTADNDSETKQTTGSSSRFKIVTDQEVNDLGMWQNRNLTKPIFSTGNCSVFRAMHGGGGPRINDHIGTFWVKLYWFLDMM